MDQGQLFVNVYKLKLNSMLNESKASAKACRPQKLLGYRATYYFYKNMLLKMQAQGKHLFRIFVGDVRACI